MPGLDQLRAHQAVFYNWFLQEAGLDSVDLVGVGLGGWIAAEMAIMDASRLRHLALIGAAGIRPREGEILDIFVIPWRQLIERAFYDAQRRCMNSAPLVVSTTRPPGTRTRRSAPGSGT